MIEGNWDDKTPKPEEVLSVKLSAKSSMTPLSSIGGIPELQPEQYAAIIAGIPEFSLARHIAEYQYLKTKAARDTLTIHLRVLTWSAWENRKTKVQMDIADNLVDLALVELRSGSQERKSLTRRDYCTFLGIGSNTWQHKVKPVYKRLMEWAEGAEREAIHHIRKGIKAGRYVEL